MLRLMVVKKMNDVKNKNGFTFIEIIAVIVLLGILLFFVSVPVSKYIENSKAKTYKSHEKELTVAAENYIIDCLANNEEGCTIPIFGQKLLLTYETLVEQGYSKELEDPESDGYCDRSFVIAENKSNNGVDLEYQSCLICSNYPLEEVEGCKEEINVPPTCELEIIGDEIGGWYKLGTAVKFKNVYDENINTVVFGIGTELNNPNYSGNDSYIVNNSGITTVFGYVKDEKGNTGYCSAEVKINDTAPEAILYMGYEIYPKENTTFSNNLVTISNLSKYGKISGLIVEFSDNLSTSASSDITSNGVSISEEGAFLSGRDHSVFKINPGTYENITINLKNSQIRDLVSNIYLLKEETATSVWTNKDVVLYVDASDYVDNYSYNNGANYTSQNIKKFSSNTNGNIVVKDQFGNESDEYSYKITKIDRDEPTLELDYTIDETTEGSLYVSSVSYNASDSGSGAVQVEYLSNTTGEVPDDNETGDSKEINGSQSYGSTSFDYYLYYRAVDNAGNTSSWKKINRFIGNQISISFYNNIDVGNV